MLWKTAAHNAPAAMTTAISFIVVMLWVAPAKSQDSDPIEKAGSLFGFAVRNSVLESRFARTRNEQEAISKSLMNSNVTGTQSTATETRLKIVPNQKSLQFELLNTGHVTSQTTGFNNQATVDSLGQHHFEITKPLWFDGSVFLTRPAHGTIQASQTPQRVFSAIGVQMPLLSPFSDRVAWDEVLRRTPQINQVVAEDVSRDVLPKIDRLIDADFAKLQKEWTATQRKVRAAFGNTPLNWAARSSEEIASVWTTSVQKQNTGVVSAAPAAIHELRNDEAVALFVSEDAVNSLLEQHFPGGLKITDTQLQQLQLPGSGEGLQSEFSIDRVVRLMASLTRSGKNEATLFTLEFAPERPIQVQFADGDIRLNTTFQIIPKVGAPSGWMTTGFNLRGKRLSQEHWTVAVRSVDVGESSDEKSSIVSGSDLLDSPPLIIPVNAEGDDRPAMAKEEITTVESGTVWMPIVRNAAESLAEKIPPVRLPIEFDGSSFVPGSPEFRLGKIDSANGMLRVGLRVVDAVPEVNAR